MLLVELQTFFQGFYGTFLVFVFDQPLLLDQKYFSKKKFPLWLNKHVLDFLQFRLDLLSTPTCNQQIKLENQNPNLKLEAAPVAIDQSTSTFEDGSAHLHALHLRFI